MSNRRLHVVVRADLEPGMMLAQSNHATQDFVRRFPNEDTGDTMIVLEASHADLGWLCAKAMRDQVACMPFFEPDMDGELTAAAFGNDAKKMLADLSLALKPKKKPSRTLEPPRKCMGFLGITKCERPAINGVFCAECEAEFQSDPEAYK